MIGEGAGSICLRVPLLLLAAPFAHVDVAYGQTKANHGIWLLDFFLLTTESTLLLFWDVLASEDL